MNPNISNTTGKQTDAKQHGAGKGRCVSPQQKGFTLVELVVVFGVLLCGTAVIVPALAKTRPASKTFQCLYNHRQLTRAWQMYAADSNDRVVNNFGVSDTEAAINSGKFDNWVNNVMTWSGGNALDARSNTNEAWVTSGGIGRYADAPVSAYRCPADNYVSPVQKSLGWTGRIRSVAMNSVFGRFSNGNDSTAQGQNWALPQYAQFLKQTEVPKPYKTWLFVEEHPDSINDGYYLNNTTASSWQDIPASYHDGACTFSFADGHAELMKWSSNTSRYPVKFIYPSNRVFDSLGKADFAWYLERTGYIDRRSGTPQFGY